MCLRLYLEINLKREEKIQVTGIFVCCLIFSIITINFSVQHQMIFLRSRNGVLSVKCKQNCYILHKRSPCFNPVMASVQILISTCGICGGRSNTTSYSPSASVFCCQYNSRRVLCYVSSSKRLVTQKNKLAKHGNLSKK